MILPAMGLTSAAPNRRCFAVQYIATLLNFGCVGFITIIIFLIACIILSVIVLQQQSGETEIKLLGFFSIKSSK